MNTITAKFTQPNNAANFGIDFARVVACLMVIVVHVAATNFYTFSDKWWATNFWDSLTRGCVPLFLMISGALLLNKDESLGVFIRKRFSKIIPPLLFWSLAYLALNNYRHVEPLTIMQIFLGPAMYHLWYLYAILGLYLF